MFVNKVTKSNKKIGQNNFYKIIAIKKEMIAWQKMKSH